MSFRNLAEAVILQSLEDLCTPEYREENVAFFRGDAFKIYADIAELNSFNKVKTMKLTGGTKYERRTIAHGV